MQWHQLQSPQELEALISQSFDKPVMIFKHSTRCSISSMALDRLQRSWSESEMEALAPYYLDLISYRDVSNEVARLLQVEHQSPQLLLLKNGEVVYHTSHMGISYQQLKQELASVPS